MTICLDAAAAYVMERVDIVLVGAEGVVENGGIVNKLGTYQLALAAKALGKPVYVAAESFKMVRLYPLNQQDLPEAEQPVDFGRALPAEVRATCTARAYTRGAAGPYGADRRDPPRACTDEDPQSNQGLHTTRAAHAAGDRSRAAYALRGVGHAHHAAHAVSLAADSVF